MRYLVTGAAGFIGFHTSKRLLERGDEVVGVDIVNDYYDPTLEARLRILEDYDGFTFHRTDSDRDGRALPDGGRPARDQPRRAGGRPLPADEPARVRRLQHRRLQNVLEGYATTRSSTSPTRRRAGLRPEHREPVHHNVDHPISLYAASKKANELMAHTYSHLYQLPTTGLRHGSAWGRPDMALFTVAILEGAPSRSSFTAT